MTREQVTERVPKSDRDQATPKHGDQAAAEDSLSVGGKENKLETFSKCPQHPPSQPGLSPCPQARVASAPRGSPAAPTMGLCWLGSSTRDPVPPSLLPFAGLTTTVGGGILRGFGLRVCRPATLRIEPAACGLGHCCLDHQPWPGDGSSSLLLEVPRDLVRLPGSNLPLWPPQPRGSTEHVRKPLRCFHTQNTTRPLTAPGQLFISHHSASRPPCWSLTTSRSFHLGALGSTPCPRQVFTQRSLLIC